MTNPSDSFSRMTSIAQQLVGIEVLVVDQDERVHRGITQLLSQSGLHITCAADPEGGLALVERQFFSVILCDLDTPAPGAGIETIREIKKRSPTSMLIAMTPRRAYDDAVSAVRAGAIDLIVKSPDAVQYLADRVREAAGRSVGKREVDSVLAEVRAVQEDFLQRFMEAEKRALDLQDRLAGKDPNRTIDIGELQVLLVDEVDELAEALIAAAPPGYAFIHATSGGEGLDRASSGKFHYAMIAADLADLPAQVLVSTVKATNPETVVLQYIGPSDNGRVELCEAAGTTRILIQPFNHPAQILTRLDELAEAFRAKSRERRYLQTFRERHYDFLRRYVELKTKIERALSEGPG
jgi:DNA-binding response OmpR family regulator